MPGNMPATIDGSGTGAIAPIVANSVSQPLKSMNTSGSAPPAVAISNFSWLAVVGSDWTSTAIPVAAVKAGMRRGE